MGLRFHKMTGSGNDFVVIDGRASPVAEWPTARILAACDRRTGIGADGLVILTPEGPGSVRMAFFNADGTRAAMCGNAALCSTRLAARLELADPAGMRLVTDAGTLATRCVGPGDMAEINLGDFAVPAPVAGIAPGSGEEAITLATVGVPHLVVRVEDVDAVNLDVRGRELRRHPATGPAGANANFVGPSTNPGGPWLIRTFERGVEGETLACGTGTVAAAVALAAAGEAALPIEFVSRGGARLVVSALLQDGIARDVWLCGQGRVVFSGEADL